MADNYTPEEIQQIFEAYNTAVKNQTPISADLSKAMKDAATGIRDHSAKMEAAWKKLGTSAVDLTKNLYKGEQGAKTFGDAVETAAIALETMILLIPGIGIAAKVAAVAIAALAKGVNAAAKQGDQLYKTYQDLNKIGAATAGGMSDVFDSMQKFGYGLEELDKMTALIQQNSEALSNFGGTVGSGARAFANAADQIQHSEIGKSLQMLGKTPDEINKGIAGFVKQQTLLGRGQADVNKDLVSGSAAYVKNLDLLSRLTGQNAEQLQAKQEQALAEDAYNQTQYELKRKMDAGDLAAAQKYQANIDIASRLTGTALKEFQQGVGGDLSAMSKTFMTAQGAVAVLGKSSYTADEYLQALKDGADKTRGSLGGLAKFNATNDFILPMQEISQIQSKYASETAEQITARAKLEQQVTDPATKAATELRISQQVARDQLQSFVQLGVNPAIQALNVLAGAAAGTSKVLPGRSNTSGAMGGGSNSPFGGALNQQKASLVPAGGGGGGPKNESQQAYYDKMYNSLLKAAKDQGLKNAEVVAKLGAAQTSLETGYGKHMVGNNAFGIKAKAGGPQVGASTQEFVNGKMVTMNQNFRKYNSPEESASDYIKFLTENKRYKGVLGSTNINDAITAQGQTGYATDPNYASKLASINAKFEPSLNGINPSQDMKGSQQAQNTAAPGSTEHAEKTNSLLVSLNNELAQLNKVNRNQLDVQQKTLQRQS